MNILFSLSYQTHINWSRKKNRAATTWVTKMNVFMCEMFCLKCFICEMFVDMKTTNYLVLPVWMNSINVCTCIILCVCACMRAHMKENNTTRFEIYFIFSTVDKRLYKDKIRYLRFTSRLQVKVEYFIFRTINICR